MFDWKQVLFYWRASFIAPFHFKPKGDCPMNRVDCPIWNCKYHYIGGRYNRDCVR